MALCYYKCGSSGAHGQGLWQPTGFEVGGFEILEVTRQWFGQTALAARLQRRQDQDCLL